jgi:hypothetical protein
MALWQSFGRWHGVDWVELRTVHGDRGRFDAQDMGTEGDQLKPCGDRLFHLLLREASLRADGRDDLWNGLAGRCERLVAE